VGNIYSRHPYFLQQLQYRQATVGNNADTVLLYKKDTLFVTGTIASVFPFNFSKNTPVKYNSRFKTLLLLENPAVVAMPEGVYELYITNHLPRINNLSSSQPGFVTVLDLYSLTEPAAGKHLEVDISEHIKKLFSTRQPLLSSYITIHFGAIKQADGNYSSKAGELRFTGIRIMQVKN
jgi:hypothetical protein